jgi:hypothetical protein
MAPVFEASRIRRAYREVRGFTATELIDAEDRLDLARRRKINSDVAEIMIGAIPGAPAAKNLDRYVSAVIATAEACGEAMSPLSIACTVGELVRRKKSRRRTNSPHGTAPNSAGSTPWPQRSTGSRRRRFGRPVRTSARERPGSMT